MTQSRTGPSQIVLCHRWQTTAFRVCFHDCPDHLWVKPWPQILPALLIDRINGPAVMPAPTVQLSTASFTHCGTGIVRMWPAFPLRSAMTQWPSRSWRSSNRKFVTSALRRPQPIRSESKARFRRLRRVSAVSAPSNFLPSSAVSHFRHALPADGRPSHAECLPQDPG